MVVQLLIYYHRLSLCIQGTHDKPEDARNKIPFIPVYTGNTGGTINGEGLIIRLSLCIQGTLILM